MPPDCRGLSRAEAARQAITETAEREHRRSGLAIDARALGAPAGHLTREELRSVEDALLLVLDPP